MGPTTWRGRDIGMRCLFRRVGRAPLLPGARRQHMESITFRSKIDWWLVAVVLVSAAVSLMAVIIVAVLESPLLGLAFSPLLLLGIGLPVWLLRATYYKIEPAELYIRCGPFVWRVPLDDIRAITPTRNPLSSPALSLDRLRIDFGRKRWIMVSPAEKEAFVAELRKRLPAAS